jgi:hypothetical protein
MTKPKEQKALDAIVDTVLAYRPTAKSEPARQRKRRKTILEKQRKKSADAAADDEYFRSGTRYPGQ